MRRPGFAAPGKLIFAILLIIGVTGAAPAAARQDASPAAGTPAAPPQPTQVATQPAGAPAATPAAPAAPAQTDVVTLVLWYSNPLDRDVIDIFPIGVGANFVAGPTSGAGSVGTVTFPEDGSVPTVVLGDTTFETYPRPDGVVERWTWFDDFEGARPGTLVMQMAGLDGTYQNFFGTGTFMSRDEGGVGGVLILALRPPSPAAAEPAAAEAPAADAAAAEAPADAAADAAVQPEATVDPGTEIVIEPPAEGEAPVEGEVVTEPAA